MCQFLPGGVLREQQENTDAETADQRGDPCALGQLDRLGLPGFDGLRLGDGLLAHAQTTLTMSPVRTLCFSSRAMSTASRLSRGVVTFGSSLRSTQPRKYSISAK